MLDQDGTYHQTQPIDDNCNSMTREIEHLKDNEQSERNKKLTQLRNQDYDQQYQSFGKIGLAASNEGQKAQAERAILLQQQYIKTGGKSSITALVDPDNDN